MLKQIRYLIPAMLLTVATGQLSADDGRHLRYQNILLIPDDSARCARLIRYAGVVSDSLHDYNFAQLIFEKAEAIFRKKKYQDLQPELYYKWSLALYDKGDFEAADKLSIKALSFQSLENKPPLKAKVLTLAGANLQNLMVYKRSLIYYNEALELYTRQNDIKGKGTVYQNMANIFAMTGNLSQSDTFFDKAADIFLRNGITDKYGIVLGNKAFVKWKRGDLNGAKKLLIRSLALQFKKSDPVSGLSDRSMNLGLIYAELEQWDSCFYMLKRSKRIADSLGLSESMSGTYYYYLGYCYAVKGDLKHAIMYYKQALKIKTGISDYRMLYENIAGIYFQNKQYDSAFLYKAEALGIVDSIYKSELKEHVTFENKRIELLEKDYQNQIRSALQQRSLVELKKSNYLLISIIIILTTAVLLFFLYFSQYRLKVKKEHLQSELDFLKAQLNPHFLFNSINNIYVLLDGNKEKASDILLKFSELMRYQLYECNVSLISLAKELRFLENYIEFEKLRYSNRIDVRYDLDYSGNGALLIAPLLLQPFIENAFKHTPKNKDQRSRIDIRSTVTGDLLLLEISNTVDVSETSALPGGIGLKNVKKRLKLIYTGRHELQIVHDDHQYKITLKLTLAYD